MTDDLITDLSKISGLFVIARNSTFQYKGKAADFKKISRELGIRYVLEGSVRRVQNKVVCIPFECLVSIYPLFLLPTPSQHVFLQK